jgi:putative aldouronate transport system substrate-binding protein
MLASGDYPDLMLSITHENIAQLSQAGALVPMDEYVEKYGTNIKKIFGDKIGAMKSEIDGKIYGFNREFGGMPTKSPVNMQIQYAMLQDAGFPKITTLDELYALIKNYKQKNPQYEGKDTIGLSSWGASWGFNTTFNNAALRTSGYQDDGNFYINPDTLESKYGLTTDAAKLYLKWLNKMNREGLFDKDSFVQKDEAFQAKLISGRVLASSNAWWNIEQAEAALKKAGKEDRVYAELPVYVSQEAADKSRISYYDPFGSWKSAITKNCKDPERAFKFFDQMWSEEMQVLCNWGVEGESYTVDASGKRTMKPDFLNGYFSDDTFMSRTGIKAYYYWSCGPVVKDSTGQYLDPFTAPEIEASQFTELDKTVLHAYNPDAITWVDLAPKPQASPWGFAWKLTLPSDSEGAIAQNKVENEIRVNAVVKMVEAKTDEVFENEWQSFLKQCKDAGIEKREKEINDALKTRMDLWYK